MKRGFSWRRQLSIWLRLPISGPIFRFYAPRRQFASANPPSGMEPIRRLLIVNLMPSLGDTICYFPLLDVLAETHPEIEISWLVDQAMAPLVKLHPAVHKVYPLSVPPSRLLRVPTLKTYYRLWAMMRSLSRTEIDAPFDLALAPRGGVDPSFSAHAVWMLNLPKSIGYSHRVEPDDIDHNFGDCLLSDVVNEVPELHESMRALHLLRVAGLVNDPGAHWNPRFTIEGVRRLAEAQDISSLLDRLGLSADGMFAVVAPGAGLPKKTWSKGKFRDLSKRILAETDLHVVAVGTRSEASLCDEVIRGLGSRAQSCAGLLELQELAGLLSIAQIFVGNDSGVGHIAGGLGVPTVSLHVQPKTADPRHISAPEHYRPAGPQVTVLQPDNFLPPCHDRCEASHIHCMDQITVDQVWEAVRTILSNLRLITVQT